MSAIAQRFFSLGADDTTSANSMLSRFSRLIVTLVRSRRTLSPPRCRAVGQNGSPVRGSIRLVWADELASLLFLWLAMLRAIEASAIARVCA